MRLLSKDQFRLNVFSFFELGEGEEESIFRILSILIFEEISFGEFRLGNIWPKYFHTRRTRVSRYHFSGNGRSVGTSEFFVGEERVTERGRSMRQDLCD